MQYPAVSDMTDYMQEIRLLRQEKAHRPAMPHSDYIGFASNLATDLRVLPSYNIRKKYKVLVPALFAMSKRNYGFESSSTSSSSVPFTPSTTTITSTSTSTTLVSSDINTTNSTSNTMAKSTAGGDSNTNIAIQTLNDLQSDIEKYKKGYKIAYDILQSLNGVWKMEKHLVSKLDSSPSGTVIGHVTFTPILTSNYVQTINSRSSSGSSSMSKVDSNTATKPTQSVNTSNSTVGNNKSTTNPLPIYDLMYDEEGEFLTENGMKFEVSRKYIYTYNPEKDTLDIYFVKYDEANKMYIKDYIFVTLSFHASEEGWIGDCCHPCGQDIYESSFMFSFQGIFLKKAYMKYTVSGPFKDYLSITNLSRDFPSSK